MSSFVLELPRRDTSCPEPLERAAMTDERPTLSSYTIETPCFTCLSAYATIDKTSLVQMDVLTPSPRFVLSDLMIVHDDRMAVIALCRAAH